MKIVIVFLVLSIMSYTSFSQNSVVGKWKITLFESKEMGVLKITIEDIAVKLTAEKMVQKKDTALTKEDDDAIMQEAENLYNELSKTKIEYKANKTFIGQYNDEITNGTYIYDKAKKTITTKVKNKPAKKAKIWFKDGLLVMSDMEGNTKSYFTKEK